MVKQIRVWTRPENLSRTGIDELSAPRCDHFTAIGADGVAAGSEMRPQALTSRGLPGPGVEHVESVVLTCMPRNISFGLGPWETMPL